MGKKFMEQLKNFFSLRGLLAILLTSAGVGYFLAAFDLIPDTIPVVGYVDDIALIVIVMLALHWLFRRFGWLQKGEKK